MSTFQIFHETWSHEGDKPTPVTSKSLQVVETQLGIALPQDYRTQVLDFGLLHTTDDLWEWLDKNRGFLEAWLLVRPRPHLMEFYPPETLLEAFNLRQARMPENLLPFACYSQGNQICFDLRDLELASRKMARVFIWDHAINQTWKLSRSFDAFVRLLLP